MTCLLSLGFQANFVHIQRNRDFKVSFEGYNVYGRFIRGNCSWKWESSKLPFEMDFILTQIMKGIGIAVH
jgi:hypothetical protein